MKRSLPILLFAILLAPPAPAAVNDPAHAEDALAPSTEQRYASRLATRFVAGYNYQQTQLDDDVSERIFELYLESLDPNRLYFLAEDIEVLDPYRHKLDDALKNAELDPAYEIFECYLKRVDERITHAMELLDTDFDFTVEETYRFDRSEEPWASDTDELDEIWRKRIKNDWLRLKLADETPDEIRETLSDRYTTLHDRIHEFEGGDVFQFFMNAFTRAIEPHSAYMTPRTSENFEISMSLSLEGIGALLERETEYTAVRSVVPGGPADKDGRLGAGDRIVGVGQGESGDIVDVVGWRLDDVVDLIRGPKESVVRLEVLPAETGLNGPPTVIDITRNEVKLEEQAASSEIIEIPADNSDGAMTIGIIKVPVFYIDFAGRARNEPDYRSSTRDVRRIIQELDEQGVDGIVVDLRDNGGGALLEATTMTGLFIDEGPVVQVRDRSGRVSVESDREPGMAWDGPLGVLVNRNSASASEIFAAAIQDYGRGVVLGEPTFGKGTVQNLIDLDDFSQSEEPRLGQLKLTMAQFFRITGDSTQVRGVTPDIQLPTPGDTENHGERALDYALPWSEIDTLDYDRLANLDPLIARATVRHEERRAQDDTLKDLLDDLAEWDRLNQREAISLVESVRREEMKAAEERRRNRFSGGTDSLTAVASDNESDNPETSGNNEDAEESENSENDERPDVLLRESARILSDLIDFDGEQKRLAQHRQEQPDTD